MTQAGEMTRLFRVLEPVERPDSRGSSPATYRETGRVWAKVAPIRADEMMVGDQLAGGATHKVTIHHGDLITNRSVLESTVEPGRRLEVVGIVNVGELDRYLELTCREAVP